MLRDRNPPGDYERARRVEEAKMVEGIDARRAHKAHQAEIAKRPARHRSARRPASELTRAVRAAIRGDLDRCHEILCKRLVRWSRSRKAVERERATQAKRLLALTKRTCIPPMTVLGTENLWCAESLESALRRVIAAKDALKRCDVAA